ncbi:MAG: hypothetical protein K2O65_00615 [Lachnospiraceae bacterium]|nr:hypothetical protein [Lachnospiraceae bacterium]
MQVGLSNYQLGNSNVAERADNKKTEKKQRTNTPVYPHIRHIWRNV